MNEPVRILQWGMGPNLGGVDCLMMDIYRHIDRSKVQFDFLCDHDADKLASRMRSLPWAVVCSVSWYRSTNP